SLPSLDELLAFIAERLKVHLREEGVRHDRIAAVFNRIGEARADDDIARVVARAKALQAFLDTEDGANLLTAFRRASNIVAIEERRDGRRYDDLVDREAFEQPEEAALCSSLDGMSAALETSLAREHFDRAMACLAT